MGLDIFSLSSTRAPEQRRSRSFRACEHLSPGSHQPLRRSQAHALRHRKIRVMPIFCAINPERIFCP